MASLASKVNAKPVNRRALRRYGEFWRALQMVGAALAEHIDGVLAPYAFSVGLFCLAAVTVIVLTRGRLLAVPSAGMPGRAPPPSPPWWCGWGRGRCCARCSAPPWI